MAAHWTVVPMVTGLNPCEGKGLFPGPRASLSHPAPNGYLTLVLGGWVMRGTHKAVACQCCITCQTDHLSWSVDATIFCIEGASV